MGVAQRLAAAVLATLVAAMAAPEVCVTRAVGGLMAARAVFQAAESAI